MPGFTPDTKMAFTAHWPLHFHGKLKTTLENQ